MLGNPWFGGSWAPAHLQQSINPWNFLLDQAGQFGLVNVSMNSADPAMERHIVEQVASYGRQLGRLTDAMAVLVHYLPTPASPTEREALAAFADMAHQIAAAKAGYRIPGEAELARMIDAIAYLKTNDRPAYERVSTRLEGVLNGSSHPVAVV